MFWTVQLNMNDFESNDRCEYKPKQNQRSLKVAPIKSTSTSLCLIYFVPLPLLFYQLSSIFFIDSEIYKSFPDVFHFSTRKTLLYGLFSSNVWMKQLSKWAGGYKLQAAKNGGNFGMKLTHLHGYWLSVSFFSHVIKHHLQF